jgi:hypothetical protein
MTLDQSSNVFLLLSQPLQRPSPLPSVSDYLLVSLIKRIDTLAYQPRVFSPLYRILCFFVLFHLTTEWLQVYLLARCASIKYTNDAIIRYFGCEYDAN